MKNFTLSIFLCLATTLSCWASVTIDDISYTLNSDGTSVASNGTSTGNIIIPEYITDGKNTYTVTAIGNYAFANTSITSISLPSTITSIGNGAFSPCTKLNNINIPENVTTIGSCAFSGCTSLTTITIPAKVTSVGDHAFKDCTNLASVTIGATVSSLGDYVFETCTSLTSITCNGAAASLGTDAFFNVNTSNITVNVPADQASSYSSWGYSFKNLNNSTAVKIATDNASYIYGINNGIVINGNAEIYTINGTLVFKGKASTVNVNIGTYIVNTNNTTKKVIVY